MKWAGLELQCRPFVPVPAMNQIASSSLLFLCAALVAQDPRR